MITTKCVHVFQLTPEIDCIYKCKTLPKKKRRNKGEHICQ